MNKIVIFDWGGVVESHENNMEELMQIRVDTIKRFNESLSREEILSRWTNITTKGNNAGAVSDIKEIKEWLALIERNMEIDVPLAEFVSTYNEEGRKIKYYKDVVEYAHSIKEECQIAILSNLLPIDKDRIDYQYDLSKFNHVYLSFEIGLRKPDSKIYEHVTKDLNVNPKDILFIDDDKDNITAAKEYGWNTCEAFGYELDKIKTSVKNFLNTK